MALSAAPAAAQQGGNAELGRLGDEMVALQLDRDPTLAYMSGLPAPDHRRWVDRSPAATRAYERKMDALLQRTNRLDAASLSEEDRRTYAILKELLESEQQSRVCKSEL